MYLEGSESMPDASVVDAKDHEVLWFDFSHVRFMNNCKCATLHIIDARGVELARRGFRARPVPPTNISAVPLCKLNIHSA